MDAFACPPDCGHCCSHLEREPVPGDDEFRDVLRDHGVYHCADAARVGLSLSHTEAAALRDEAKARGIRLRLHPRTYLLETRRRVAVVLDWHMPHASCPFLDRYRCGAYDKRPLVCRAYPVMLASPLAFAPECPKQPAPRAAVKAELTARRAIDRAHAALDERGWGVLSTPGARFAHGLTPREAAARVRRYRHMTPEEFLSARATPSTS